MAKPKTNAFNVALSLVSRDANKMFDAGKLLAQTTTNLDDLKEYFDRVLDVRDDADAKLRELAEIFANRAAYLAKSGKKPRHVVNDMVWRLSEGDDA